jgi:tRNA threonylcarbamoyladenosine biosynthesis protein TsaE
MKQKTVIFDYVQLPVIVQKLWQLAQHCTVFTLQGSLGAGKTTLVKALLKEVGVTDTITSPTFNYVNVYSNSRGQLFYHFDLYRIVSLEEFIQAGFNEYLYVPGSWCFIEWPEIIMPLLYEKICAITIDFQKDDKRLLRVTIKE